MTRLSRNEDVALSAKGWNWTPLVLALTLVAYAGLLVILLLAGMTWVVSGGGL
jgi:hypothetical protein